MSKKIFLLLVFAFFFIIIIFFYLLIIERNPSNLPSQLIEKKVPVFNSKLLFNGKKFISTSEFKNNITVVNFFATWCAPCRDEHKYIIKLSKDNSIKIIGINYKDNPDKAIIWLKDLKNPYFKVITDPKGKIAIDWGVYGIPETFLVSSKGIIKYKHVGPINKKIYRKLKKKISMLKK
jgi:cytochrome c biogenesis protein CcmG/thiol:disulfide interchange protein DsbE